MAQEFTRRADEIDAKMEEADTASMSLGFPFKNSHGKWQLISPASSQSFFEEALCFYLREIGLTVPANPMRSETILGRSFDPAQADAYLNSFAIKR